MPANARAEARARYLATPFGVQSAAGGTSAMRARYRQPILAIMTVVALVLLIACANVANLFLARASRAPPRIQRAPGARRVALAARPPAARREPAAGGRRQRRRPRRSRGGRATCSSGNSRRRRTRCSSTRSLDWRVLAFTASVAIAVALLFGVVPALRASRTEPIDAIREHGRGTAGERGIGFGGALVAGQVALSLVLVVAAGLFIRTFTTLATLNVGFDRDPVLLVRLDVPRTSAEPSQRAALYERVAATVRATPGVAHAAISEVTPVSGMITDVYVEAENGPRLAPPQNVSYRNVITPDWFATYGTRLVAGRDFDDRDRLASPPVAIVNETFARRFLQGAQSTRPAHPQSVLGAGRDAAVDGGRGRCRGRDLSVAARRRAADDVHAAGAAAGRLGLVLVR